MDSLAYDAIVDKVLSTPCLADELKDLIDPADSYLNLVTPQWKAVLENNSQFQNFQLKAQSMFTPKNTSFNGLFVSQNLYDAFHVVLMARIYTTRKPTDYSVKDDRFILNLRDSPPLNMLLTALTSDVPKEKVDLSDSVRVTFNTCSRFCQYCGQASALMKLKELKSQPCILKFAIYNGKSVVNRFPSQTEGLFSKTCIGIVKLKFNCRYFFDQKDGPNNVLRLTAEGVKVIAFPESNLIKSKFCLGDFTTLNAYGEEEEAPMVKAGETSRKRELEEEVVEIMPISTTEAPMVKAGETPRKRELEEEEEVVEIIPISKFQRLEGDKTKVVCEKLIEII